MKRYAINLTQDMIGFKGNHPNPKFVLLFGWLLSLSFFSPPPLIAQSSVKIQSINAKNSTGYSNSINYNNRIRVGAERTWLYLPLIRGKKIAMVSNQTSTIGKTHLVDSLQKLGIDIRLVFAPEHGFRGDAENGATVLNGMDAKTGLRIISLYGSNLKPLASDLKEIDCVLFDIQDVGTRFYTYLTTLHYVMESCAENKKQLIVLDRPNPNGYFIDGPVLNTEFRSMVGMHPIPIVHGMTLGELASMINGEKWLPDLRHCPLTIIQCENYDHNKSYILPIPPSPNLPNQNAIYLYPTLCLLEGTQMSMGRGTAYPFECYGSPWLRKGSFLFVPQNIKGKALNPPFLNDTCHGVLLSDFANEFIVSFQHLYIEWLIMLYKECPDKNKFFNPFFLKLSGSDELKKQIMAGNSAEEIRKSWQSGIEKFSTDRKPYLLYPFDPTLGLKK